MFIIIIKLYKHIKIVVLVFVKSDSFCVHTQVYKN